MAINWVLNYYGQHKLQQQFVEICENRPEDIAGLSELSFAFQQAHNQEMESLLVMI